MGWTALLAVASFALLAPPAATAAEGRTVKELLALAAKEEKVPNPEGAAGLYGEALAAAQKPGALLLEEEAAEAFLRLLSGASREDRRDLLAATMRAMDPRRGGAFVSAPLLAGEILLGDVARADGKHVKESAAVLAAHAKSVFSGAGLRCLAEFGAALRECRGGDGAKADAGLKSVLERASAGEWADLVIAAGIERAALRLRLGDAEGAAAAVGEAAAVVTPKTEQRYLRLFRDLVDARLKHAPEAVLKPWKDAMGYLKKDAPGVAPPAGAGGAGGSGPPRDSPYGLAIKPTGKARFLAAVTRTKDGYEVRVGWDPKFREAVPKAPGVTHVTQGGLTLAFADGAVAVRHGEPVEGPGAPGADSAPAPGRAWYRLAPGETWTLRRDGTVTFPDK